MEDHMYHPDTRTGESSGYYEPHKAVRSSEGAAVLQRLAATVKKVEALLADVGKVRYSEVGPGAVAPAVLEATLRAKALFHAWVDPGLGGIEIKWVREESAAEREYLERWPADRGDPEINDVIFERDSPINGLAGRFDDDTIYLNADLDVGQVVSIVAHELQHKRQPLGMLPEAREADARQVAANFCEKFFPQSERRAWTLEELVLLSRGF